jgi:hypothetical protein
MKSLIPISRIVNKTCWLIDYQVSPQVFYTVEENLWFKIFEDQTCQIISAQIFEIANE